MKIGIIGAGMIGGTLAELWARAGHQVWVSSRHPETLSPPAGVLATTIERAVELGEAVLLAVPFAATAALDAGVKASLRGKVVLDANNPIARRDGAVAQQVVDGGQGSATWTAAQLPEVRVVKAFNTVYFKVMLAQGGRPERGRPEPVGVPLAGDDAEALAIAAKLVSEAGMAPVIVGDASTSARFDPGTPLWNSSMTAAQLRAALGLGE